MVRRSDQYDDARFFAGCGKGIVGGQHKGVFQRSQARRFGQALQRDSMPSDAESRLHENVNTEKSDWSTN